MPRSPLDHSPLAAGDVVLAFLRGYMELGNKQAVTEKLNRSGRSVNSASLHGEEYLPSVPRPPALLNKPGAASDGAQGGKPQVVTFDDDKDKDKDKAAVARAATTTSTSTSDAAYHLPGNYPKAVRDELNAEREANLRIVFEYHSKCGPSGEEIASSEFVRLLISLGMLPEDDPDTPEDERYVAGLPSNHQLTCVDATLFFDKADVNAGRALGKGRNHKLDFTETLSALHEACCVWFLGRDRPKGRSEHHAQERRAFAELCDGVVARAARNMGARVDPHAAAMKLPRCQAAIMRYAPNLAAIFEFYAAADQDNIDTSSAAALQHANTSLNIKELEDMLRDFEVLPQLITKRELTHVFRWANAADEGDEFFNDLNLVEFVDCIGRIGLTIGERLYKKLLDGAGMGGPPGAPPDLAKANERPLPKEMVLMRVFFDKLPGEEAKRHVNMLLKACAHGGKDSSKRTNVTRELTSQPDMGSLMPEDSSASLDPWFQEELRARQKRSGKVGGVFPPAQRKPRWPTPPAKLPPGGFKGIEADVHLDAAVSRVRRLESVLSEALGAAEVGSPTPSALERGLRSALESAALTRTVLKQKPKTPPLAADDGREGLEEEQVVAKEDLSQRLGAVAEDSSEGAPLNASVRGVPNPTQQGSKAPAWLKRQVRRDAPGVSGGLRGLIASS